MNLLSDNKYMLMDQYEIEDTVPSSQENIKFYGLQNSTHKKIKTHFWIWIWSSQDEIIFEGTRPRLLYSNQRKTKTNRSSVCVRKCPSARSDPRPVYRHSCFCQTSQEQSGFSFSPGWTFNNRKTNLKRVSQQRSRPGTVRALKRVTSNLWTEGNYSNQQSYS